MLTKTLKITFILLFFCSCQNLEDKSFDITNSNFDNLKRYEAFEKNLSSEIPKYTIFSNYDQLINELKLKKLEQRKINIDRLTNENDLNNIFIPALIGLITISAMSSNRGSYKPSNVSENMEMDSEWIE